jgi:hypothetical protein
MPGESMPMGQALNLAIESLRREIGRVQREAVELAELPKRALNEEQRQALRAYDQLQAALLVLIAERARVRDGQALAQVHKGGI